MDRRLQETILRGDTPTFLNLVQENTEIIHQRASSNTVLHLAIRFGHREMVEEIVRLQPVMVAAVNEKMETPLYDACREGRVEMVRMLVEKDPSIIYKLNQHNQTVLFVACESGKLDVVDYLLEFQQLLMVEVDASATSLHVAASGGYAEIVKQILRARPDFSWQKDQNGCTPLHLSCSKGHLEVTRELLRFDIDLSSIQDNEGRTPLHWAAIKGRLNIIDEILSMSLQSADMLTNHGETVLHLGVKNNQFEAVKFLSENLDVSKLVNRPDNDGNTALHLATAGKLSTMVIYLLKIGANVNAINRKGQTALDIVESDVSNSGALLILPALKEEGANRCDQLPPSSSLEIPQIEHGMTPTSTPKRLPKSPTPSHEHHRHSHRRRHRKQIELQTEGLRNARKTITVVAVLIAGVTFAAGINPPGGFNEKTGIALMGRRTAFKVFVVCNIVALFSSLGIVIVLVSIIPFRRKSMMNLLVLTHKVMWLSMSFMAAAYVAAMWTVVPHGRRTVWVLATLVSIGAGCTLAIFVGLGYLLARHWMRKSEWRKNKAKRKDGSPSSSISRVEEMRMMRRGSRDTTSNSDVDSSDQAGYHLY